MSKSHERLSTLDLFQRGWVLVSEDARWTSAATRARELLGVEVSSIRVGVDVQAASIEAFRSAFGLSATGASLIRPDGYVAWRTVELPLDPISALYDALVASSAAARAASP